MYKIALFGSSGKVVDLYNAIQKEKNCYVSAVIDPTGKNLKPSYFLPGTYKRNVSDLKYEDDIFAIVNVDDSPELIEELKSAGLEKIKVISGASASFLYETEVSEATRRESYKKIVEDFKVIASNFSMLFDREKLLNEILRNLCTRTDAHRASIMLYDKKERVLKVSMAYGIDPVLWDFIRIPIGEGIAGKVVENKEPMLITGKPDDKIFKKLRKREDIKSAICVPLIKNDDVVGVINLANLDKIDGFTKEDLEFAKEMAGVVTEIISASKSFYEFKEDAIRYEIINYVSQVIAENISLYDRLMKIVNYLKESLNVYSMIGIHGDDGSFETYATNFSMWDQPEIFGEDTIEKMVFQTKKDLTFVDLENKGFRGYISIPLIYNEKCIGVISMVNFGEPLPERVDFYKELGKQISKLIVLSYKNESMAEINRRNDIIDSAIKNISNLKDLVSIGNLVLDVLNREFEALIGVFRIFDEDRNSYIVKDVKGIENVIKKDFFQIDKEIAKKALKEKIPFFVRNTRKDKDYSGLYPSIQNFLVYPFSLDGKQLMVFSFYNCESRKYSKSPNVYDINFINKLFEKGYDKIKEIYKSSQIFSEIYIDSLTGLPNFQYFEKRVFEEVMRAKRNKERLIVLVAEFQPYDLYLKTYGKKKADEVIKRIGQKMRESIRSYEVVARLNLNKFGVILVEADEKALEVIFRLKKILSMENWDPKGLIKEGISIKYGYARFPEDGEEYDELIVKANHIRG
ncbi:MAG: GAF domain-containing protein [Proteobacteria bacterium]|nr:GAF domain-containing protein [Pseudomonadota bacterium]